MALERIAPPLSEIETSPVFDQSSAEQNIARIQEWLKHLQFMIETGLFPIYRSIWEVNNLFPELRRIAQTLFDNLEPLALESPTPWGEAWAMLWGDVTLGFREKHPRSEIIKLEPFERIFPRSFFLDHSHSASQPESSLVDSIWWDILCTADSAAVWETLLEKPNPLNPALLVLRLYELGISRIEFYQVSEWEGLKCACLVSEKMVVDFPLRPPFSGKVACLAIGHRNEGDHCVRFVHDFFASCDQGQPIFTLRQPSLLQRTIVFGGDTQDHLPDPE